MAANPSSLDAFSDLDPRVSALANKLREKTRQRKVSWVRSPTAFTCSIQGQMQVNFVLAAQVFTIGLYPKWQLFVIRDTLGRELVRVENFTNVLAVLMSGGKRTEAMEAIDQLFSAVQSAAKDELDKVIDSIDRI